MKPYEISNFYFELEMKAIISFPLMLRIISDDTKERRVVVGSNLISLKEDVNVIGYIDSFFKEVHLKNNFFAISTMGLFTIGLFNANICRYIVSTVIKSGHIFKFDFNVERENVIVAEINITTIIVPWFSKIKVCFDNEDDRNLLCLISSYLLQQLHTYTGYA